MPHGIWGYLLDRTSFMGWNKKKPYLDLPQELFTKEHGKRKCLDKPKAKALLITYLLTYTEALLVQTLEAMKDKHCTIANSSTESIDDLIQILDSRGLIQEGSLLQTVMAHYQQALQEKIHHPEMTSRDPWQELRDHMTGLLSQLTSRTGNTENQDISHLQKIPLKNSNHDSKGYVSYSKRAGGG